MDRLTKRFAPGAGARPPATRVEEAGTRLAPALAWWRAFAMRFVADLRRGRTPGRPARRPSRAGASDLAALIDERRRCGASEYLRPDSWLALEGHERRSRRTRQKRPLRAGLPQRARDSRWLSSGACISISPKTARTRTIPSPSWRPTPPAFRPRPGISRSAGAARIRRRRRQGQAPELLAGAAGGRGCAWLKGDRRCGRDLPSARAGRPRTRCASSTMSRRWSGPAWSCACRQTGA